MIQRKLFNIAIALVLWIQPILGFQNILDPSLHHLHTQQLNNLRMQQFKDQNLRKAMNSLDPTLKHGEPKKAKDFATIKNPPTNITRKMALNMTYQCTKPQVVALFVDGYEDNDRILRNSTNPLLVDEPAVFYQSAWRCDYSQAPLNTIIKVKLPKRFLYRPSITMPKVSQLEDVNLKVFMTSLDDWVFIEAQKNMLRNKMQLMYEKSQLKFQIRLHMPSPYERPEFKRKKSFSWEGKLLHDIVEEQPLKSAAEQECTDLIGYPVVMQEDAYGVIDGYYPYYNAELQRIKQLKKIRYMRDGAYEGYKPPVDLRPPQQFTLSMEVYLFSHCQSSRLCSVFQHLDSKDHFETPILLINQQGHLHLQVKVNNNNSYAHTSSWTLPARRWLRINYFQTNTLANLTIYIGKNFSEVHTFTAMFHKPLQFEEHRGYLVAGGSVHCKSINGIISYARFCRSRALAVQQVNFPKRPSAISGKFLKAYKKQQQTLRSSIKKRWQHYSDVTNTKKDVCIPYFLELVQNATKIYQRIYDQCPAVEHNIMPANFADLDEVLNELPSHLKSKDVLTRTRSALYKLFLNKLENPNVMKNMTSTMKYLKQSARLGDGLSHFLLYSIYKNGIGVETNLLKAKFHLLLGTHLGDNLCLKALAYNHLNGFCEFPSDINSAFFYYFNLAHKTQKDLLEHVEGQTSVNLARLTDEKQMKAQLSEGDDLFHWIKLQAAKGAYSAQRNMGRLLYWGQQGLQRNLEAAFKYYEEAAKGGDPVAMYDYGLVLMKGHGTEADTAKGLEMLQQAAEVENPGALNTLGWYYATDEVNMTKAVEYFEKADKLGSIDAAYNLGYMYHTGKYPGKDRDMKMAFTKYYRAASGGHIEAGLQVAHLSATGIENFVPRNPHAAVQWAKYLSEKNPTMGELVREGLQAYRKQHWSKALFIYMSLAETGFEIAQYNTAFLCESDQDEVAKYIREECVWKNWNASALLRNPHPYALNKMGDYHYYGHGGEADLEQAIRYYGSASKLNYPQALFNLASIMEEHGDVVKNETLKDLNLPKEAFQSTEDAVVQLYKKCTDIDSSEASLPCYIALLRTQTQLMWKRTSLLAKAITFIVIFLTTLILFVMSLYRRGSHTEANQVNVQQEERLENGSFSTHAGEDAQTSNGDAISVTEEHEE